MLQLRNIVVISFIGVVLGIALPVAALTDADLADSLLYEIQPAPNTVEQESWKSYLFGTFHFLPIGPMCAVVTEVAPYLAARKSDWFAIELNYSKLSSAERKPLLQSDRSLRADLSPAAQDSLTEALTHCRVGKLLPEVDPWHLHPSILIQLLSNHYSEFDFERPSMEDHLQDVAVENDLTTASLERVADHIAYLKRCRDTGIADLEQLLVSPARRKTAIRDYDRSVRQYVTGGLSGLREAFGPRLIRERLEADAVSARNGAIATGIAELLPHGRGFNAVGVGHLLGRWGVQHILREMDHRVRPVPIRFHYRFR